jgi:hypothetical protein
LRPARRYPRTRQAKTREHAVRFRDDDSRVLLASFTNSLTAWATLGVALVTALLAWSTRTLAREAGNETRANWLPVLTPEAKPDRAGIPGELSYLGARRLVLTVRNVGRGPALSLSAYLEHPAGQPNRPAISQSVVAPGERITLTWGSFDAPKPDDTLGIAAWSYVDGKISYTDVSYARHETTFKLGFRIDNKATLLPNTVVVRQLPPPSWLWSTRFRVRWATVITYRRIRGRLHRNRT